MNRKPDTYQVAIVGGGPVGLFLAISLQQAGISCVVLEKRARRITHSRSIGIHPVSLEAFEKVGLSNVFVSEGIQINKGIAYFNSTKIGTLSFNACPPPFPFLLTLPQFKTEELLTKHLMEMDPGILQRNATVTEIKQKKNKTTVKYIQKGNHKRIDALFLVGCDGKASFVREAAKIPSKGMRYDDTYIMGDFTDTTSHGQSAIVYICDDGLIESFPLGKKIRRWVIKTNHYLDNVQREDIEMRIANRINSDLSGTQCSMLSSFNVEKQFAERMVNNRFILAGDAAHVISPIGGQGMNLGWLDAQDLARCLSKIFNSNKNAKQTILEDWSNRRLKIARKAARRAEFNMMMGRKIRFQFFRKMLLHGVVDTPLRHFTARLFSMYGLESYII